MAHKKGAGSSNNGRDSISKRLGVKIYGDQLAIAGNIIVRQRGTKFHPGKGVGIGRDHTIFAMIDGKVKFTTKKHNRTYISVLPLTDEEWAALGLPPRSENVPAKKPKAAKPVVEAAKPVVETADATDVPSSSDEG